MKSNTSLQVGKLAVALTDHRCGLKKGDVKEILAMKKYSGCGCLVVDIGIQADVPTLGNLTQANCPTHPKNKSTFIGDGKWWLLASRFAPIEDLTEQQVDELLDSILNSVNPQTA